MNEGAPAPVLLGDIGGTRARFALGLSAGTFGSIVELPTAAAPLHQTIAKALSTLSPGMKIDVAILAVAGPVDGDAGQITNRGWHFAASELAKLLDLRQVRLVNDFAAVAHALPLLRPEERLLVGGGPVPTHAEPVVALGPGTGLGMAAAVPDGRGCWSVVAGEGGHITLAARTDEEWQLIASLTRRFGHVSAERICSGQGLVWLYEALAEGAIRPGQSPDAAGICERALAGERLAADCLGHFADFLGTVAGNAALVLGARGGVYLAGGVLPRLGEAFDWERFLRRFADRGRFSDYLQAIPVYRLTHSQPGLLGLTALLHG